MHMKTKMVNRRYAAAMAVALAVVAGSTSSVVADAKGGPALVASVQSGGVTTLSLAGGTPFRTTSASVLNQRILTFSGSRTVVAVWDEAVGGAVQHFSAVANDGRNFSPVEPTQNQVRLRYATFDPLVDGEPLVPENLRAGADNELFLVQFVSTPLEEMRHQVSAAGGTVERFLTENTHVVRMSAAARARVAALPSVRWIGTYHAAYRIPADLRAEIASGDAGAVRYSIECMRRGPAQQGAVAAFINQIGGIVDLTIDDQFRLEATLTPAQLIAVTRRNEVNVVGPSGFPFGADMDLVRQLEGANYIQAQGNFQGQGVRGEIFDQGVIPNHEQWNGQVPISHFALDTPTDHGTACYGINFATGLVGDVRAKGLLPMREAGIIEDYLQTNQAGLGTGTHSRLSLNTEATDPAGNYRSCYQSSSVGSPRITTYDTVAAEVDDYLLRVDYLSCQSQSNAAGARDSRPQAWAKNIVSVGGIDILETLDRSDDVCPLSGGPSVGPADDLRNKPDLANCFWNVHTTYSTATNGYGEFNGTSSATPITAGHFGLMMQMWHEGVWPGFGGGSSVFADRPKQATAKALMINTAYRYNPTPTNLMYRAYVGWGMTDVARLYDIRAHTVIVNQTDVITNGQTQTYHLTVLPGEPEFRVTMVYNDPMGNPAAAQDRINDLTLKVTSPSSVVYWGNNGMVATAISGAGQLVGSQYTAPGGAANTVDTVENVFIQNPETGSWTVEVIGTQIVQDAHLGTPAVDADFGLVACGAIAGPPPPITIAFPGGAPALIPPGQTTNIDFQVNPGTQNVQPGSPTLLYRFNNAASFISVPATSQGGNNYRAVLPAANCGDTPQFYFTAMGDQGGQASLPGNAPTNFFSTQVGTIQTTTVMDAAFSGATMPAGWTSTGLWHLGNTCGPTGGTPCAGNSWAYYGQNATCTYNTGTANSGNLVSPPMQIPTLVPGATASLTYCYSLQTENSAGHDKAEVLINGTQAEIAAESAGTWTSHTIDMTPYSGQTVTLTFRFDTVDAVFNNFRGWQINQVRVVAQATGCQSNCYANCDGSTTAPILNVADFVCFQSLFAAGDSRANCDGSTTPPVLNVGDFVCFQAAFAAGCP
jgi:hypothetical protein